MSDDDLLRPHRVAMLLGVTVETLANWRSLGLGPVYEKHKGFPNGRVFYKRADVYAWRDDNNCKHCGQMLPMRDRKRSANA